MWFIMKRSYVVYRKMVIFFTVLMYFRYNNINLDQHSTKTIYYLAYSTNFKKNFFIYVLFILSQFDLINLFHSFFWNIGRTQSVKMGPPLHGEEKKEFVYYVRLFFQQISTLTLNFFVQKIDLKDILPFLLYNFLCLLMTMAKEILCQG